MRSSQSRREFVTAAGAAALAGTVVASHAAGQDKPAAGAPVSGGGRQVVPGSTSPFYSRAVKFDKIVFVAGVLGFKPDTRELASADFEPQARQALKNLKASVEAAGSRLERVLKCGVYLTEAGDFQAFNKIYGEFFPTDPPARSTVVVKELVAAGSKVEIDCVTCVE